MAALVYTYGWFPPRICNEWSIIGGTWMPLALCCVESFLETRYWRYLFLLSVTLAVQMLAGHFMLAFITQLTLAGYVPLRLWLSSGELPAVARSSRGRILSGLALAGLALDMPCGGEGICGKCRIVVRKGAEDKVTVSFMDPEAVLSLVDQSEIEQLGNEVRQRLEKVRVPERVPARSTLFVLPRRGVFPYAGRWPPGEEGMRSLAMTCLAAAGILAGSESGALAAPQEEEGGTVIFGGVNVTRRSKNSTQVPVLGSIPIIGNLFKSIRPFGGGFRSWQIPDPRGGFSVERSSTHRQEGIGAR